MSICGFASVRIWVFSVYTYLCFFMFAYGCLYRLCLFVGVCTCLCVLNVHNEMLDIPI